LAVKPDGEGDERLLRRLAAELARLHTSEEVAAYILGAVVQVLGGNTGSLCLLTGDGNLQIVAEEGYSAAVTAVWTTFPVDAPLPASEAVRTGTAVFLTSPEDRDSRYPVFKERPVVDDNAYAIEPLVADGRVLGALVVGFTDPRQFADEEKVLLANVSAACAVAVARTRR
jgi:GAF domain-containing protein